MQRGECARINIRLNVAVSMAVDIDVVSQCNLLDARRVCARLETIWNRSMSKLTTRWHTMRFVYAR